MCQIMGLRVRRVHEGTGSGPFGVLSKVSSPSPELCARKSWLTCSARSSMASGFAQVLQVLCWYTADKWLSTRECMARMQAWAPRFEQSGVEESRAAPVSFALKGIGAAGNK